MRNGERTMRNNLFIAVCCLVVGACCPCRQAGVATAVSDRDSTYVARYDTLRIIERDTVWLARLEQSHNRVSSQATTSYLENAYCTSTAAIDEAGALTHTLDTRDSATLPARVTYRERIVRDTVIKMRDRLDTKAEIVVREIHKATWWQRTQIIVLWALLGVLAIVYRREILSLLKRIIPWI